MFEAAPVNAAGLEVVAEALAPVAEPIIVELLVAIAADEELMTMTLLEEATTADEATEAADEAGAELAAAEEAGAELTAAEEPLTA
jgi:hypothetical protein